MQHVIGTFFLIMTLEYVVCSSRKIIIDTDGGPDDVMSIISAIQYGRDTEVVGITTVCGNANSTQAAINVLKGLKVINRTEIPVYRGSVSYYMSNKDLESDYFGNDSFGDFEFENPPTTDDINQEHGVLALLRMIKENAGKVSLLCLGPLTNIALAIKLNPKFLESLQQLVVMGGTLRGNGNDSPGVEFNFRKDPESTQIVFENSSADHPILLLPWDTCLEAKIKMAWRLNKLGNLNTTTINFLNKAERKINNADGAEFWYAVDPMASFSLLQPEVIMKRSLHKVLILTEGPYSRGVALKDHTTTDFNACVVDKLNIEMFKKYLIKIFSADTHI